MNNYIFYLNDIQIEEPTGWDGLEIERKINFGSYFGLENTIITELTFVNNSSTILQDLYNEFFIDAICDFKVFCNNSLFFTGNLNFITYKVLNNEVSIKVDVNSFERLFKNRLETPISLTQLRDINNTIDTAFEFKEIKLHSKGIVLTDVQTSDIGVNISEYKDLSIAPKNYYVRLALPLPLTDKEIPNSTDYLLPINNEPFANQNTWFQNGGSYIYNETVQKFLFNGSIIGNVSIVQNRGIVSNDGNIYFNIVSYNPTLNEIEIIYQKQLGINVLPIPSYYTNNFDININLEYEVKDNRYLSVYFSHDFVGVLAEISFNVSINPNSILKTEVISTDLPSTARGMDVFECFSSICENITGYKNCFRSDYFSKFDSYLPATTDGPGAYRFLTNGRNIRKLKTNTGNTSDVFLSFKDLYQNLDKIDCLGMVIEYENNLPYIRVEPRKYFFENSDYIEISQISNITYQSDITSLYQTIEIGYSKATLNASTFLGNEEFNGKHIYSVNTEKTKESLKCICELVTSGTIIEQTRRLQFDSTQSKDFETDDDIFIICTNKEIISSNKYIDNNSYGTFAKGTVSETSENFTTVQNIKDSQTQYNLRLSPKRNLYKWLPFLSSSLYKKPSKVLNFQKGEHYYKLQTELKSTDSEYLTELIFENSSITNDTLLITTDKIKYNYNLDNFDNIYIPIIATFEYAISNKDFNIISQNIYKLIYFSCNDNFKYGFIKKINYKPNAPEGGIANFEVLMLSDFGGAYNIGYSNGYKI